MALKVVGRAITLNNGLKMPLLGLGCWQSTAGEVERAVEVALDSGYRHIDTAFAYLNEEEVGHGIHNWLKKSGNKREDIFVVTKLPMNGMTPNTVEKFANLSLKRLNLSYVDLYLIHTPIAIKGADDNDVFGLKEGMPKIDYSTDHIAIWKEMEKLVDRGVAKSIGVSNFSVKQIRKLIAASRIAPAVNQSEAHANFQQKELVDFCRENGIVFTAYAPLGSPGRLTSDLVFDSDRYPAVKLLQNPIVELIATKHKVTPAQVLIRYLIEKDIVAIPKSVTPDRIKTNGDVFSFTLDETDKAALLSLDLGEEGRTFRFTVFPGAEYHPEATF